MQPCRWGHAQGHSRFATTRRGRGLKTALASGLETVLGIRGLVALAVWSVGR